MRPYPTSEFEEVDGRQIVHGVQWLALASSICCASWLAASACYGQTRPTEVIGPGPAQYGQRQQREAGEPWYPPQ